MTRALPVDEALLTARECAVRIHCGESSWWKIARDSRILRRGKVKRGRRTFWLQSSVVEFIRFEVALDRAPQTDAVPA